MICCQGYDLIATLEGPTRNPDSTNSEAVIYCCFLKYNRALKPHPNAKVHINYTLLFVSTMRLLSIMIFSIRLLKFM